MARRRWLLVFGLLALVWLLRPRPLPSTTAELEPTAVAAPGQPAAADGAAPGSESGDRASAVARRAPRPSLLRAGGFLLLVAALAAYYANADRLPAISLWWQVAVLSLLVIPAVLALVPLSLPARGSPYLLPTVIVFAGLAALLEAKDLGIAANFVKLAAVVGAGWFFLRFFEEVSWVVLVGLLIIPVDIFSVARGPTKHILEAKPQVFQHLSIAFPVPGEHASAELGLPDVLFFALFLGAAERFHLRPRLTWLLCTASFGTTLPLAIWLDVSGLPALPLLSAGFALANGDLLWRRLRRRRA